MSKSILRTAGEGTFLISASTIVLKVIGLATVFLMLSNLEAGQYGNLELALSITALLSIFMLPGFDVVMVADIGSEIGKGNGRQAGAVLAAFLALQCILAMIAFLGTLFAAELLASAYNISTAYVQIVSFLFLLGPMRSAYGILFRARMQFFLQSLISLLEETFKLVSVWVLFFMIKPGVITVLVSILVAQSLTLIFLMPAFISSVRLLRGGEFEGIRWWHLLTGHRMWGLLASYTGNVGRSVRLWLIQHMLGPEAVGLYAVASGLIGHTTALVPLSTVLTSLLSHYAHQKERFVRLLVKGIQYQFLANMLLIVVGFLLFPPILGRLFPQYVEAFPLFQLMLFALIPGAIVTIVTPAFFALKQQKSYFASTAFKAVLTVLFSYLGIFWFGLFGLAFESIVTAGIQAFERVRSLRRHVPELPPLRLFSLRFDADDKLLFAKLRTAIMRILP